MLKTKEALMKISPDHDYILDLLKKSLEKLVVWEIVINTSDTIRVMPSLL
jgi:hypothetical protein